jgi:hypothetical protein
MTTRGRFRVLAAAAVGALLLGVADARAQEEPPPETEPVATTPAPEEPAPEPIDEVPALNEYIEDIPTASGPKATTSPRRPATRNPNRRNEPDAGSSDAGGSGNAGAQPEDDPLPRTVKEKVRREGGSLAPKLERVATSPRFGATTRPPKRERERFRRSREAETPRTPETAEAFGTAVTAGFGAGDTRMTILLVTLLATTAVAAGAAGWRHRPRGR